MLRRTFLKLSAVACITAAPLCRLFCRHDFDDAIFVCRKCGRTRESIAFGRR